MTYKILITDQLSAGGLAHLETAEDIDFEVVTGLTPQSLIERIPGYDGLIIRSSVTVSEAVLAAADQLKVIGRAGVGVDNIDMAVASRRGVVVMNTPGANTIATAEHTLAMLLALCRHIPQAQASLKTGQWNRKQFTGRQLYRKTIGIIGMGRIGSRVARRCQAFDMEVITYDPYLSDKAAQEMKVKRVDLAELLERSDFISLHAALTPGTENLINAETIAQMKPGVCLVNIARGGLVDETALLAGLQTGKIAGAALDVYAAEPLSSDSPLLTLDNVVITPHIAASTEEAQNDVGIKIVEQMLDALRGLEYRNALNLPVANAEVLRELRPFLSLAEKLGNLQAQLADDAIQRIEVELKGEPVSPHIKSITVALLKGALEPGLDRSVNYVNAPHLAQERGIVVSQTSGLATPDYANLISCRVEWKGGSRTIAATLFSHDEPRLVQIDGYRVDIRPEGIILMIHSRDMPGFIGRVGTVLGELGINIATWRTGRSEPGGLAISFINVDKDVPDHVIDLLHQFELIMKVKKVWL